MSVENQILEFLKQNQDSSVAQMQEQLALSRQMLHRVLKNLMQEKYIEKIGKPPKVFYRLLTDRKTKAAISALAGEELDFLKEYFLQITETGVRLEGLDAMRFWAGRQGLPVDKTAREFISTQKKFLKYFGKNGLINGTDKIVNTKGFERIAVHEMFYCDFYAIERFGKTKLGTLLHFAKQGQNRQLMQEIIRLTKQKIADLIAEKKIEAVGYIPPTIRRQVQIMTILQKGYNFSFPHIDLVKVTGAIPVPQKALNKIGDRISNAKASIVIKDSRQFSNILLIDDAIGSGATINETAAKLKNKRIGVKVFGIALVGSFKGFDVLQEI